MVLENMVRTITHKDLKKVTQLVLIPIYSIKTINHCSNVKRAARKKLNHSSFETSFIIIDQGLIILWHLKGARYPFFYCCSKSY